MDPIKVDFSSNNNDRGQGKSKVVMPPEKKALKIVINIVLTLIAGAVGYYFYLPVQVGSDWQIFRYFNGMEEKMSLREFKKSLRK